MSCCILVILPMILKRLYVLTKEINMIKILFKCRRCTNNFSVSAEKGYPSNVECPKCKEKV
jgi:DNA-directed RNA polymerase subunit RPC12/RpoP